MSVFENSLDPPKKMKLELNDNRELLPKQCAHWLIRKKRFCKMTVAKGHDYCGEHEPTKVSTADNIDSTIATRITCPLDATHTVYKSKLQKHLKICNARQRDDEPTYIKRAINVGPPTDDLIEEQQLQSQKLYELNDLEFYAIINNVRRLYETHIRDQIETVHFQHKSLATELSKAEYGNESRKHLLQNAALLGILEHETQFQPSTSFVEFGAGKGQLAAHLAQLLQQNKLAETQVVLLDRMSLRHKRDNKIEDRKLVQRIRVDIADFCMCELELLQQTTRTVAFSKHLCGGATDLTLRCITQSQTAVEKAINTDFIIIALCCHHRCDWRSFVGKQFCQQEGITARQFAIMTKMASWAVCGNGMSRERRRLQTEQLATQQSTNTEESVPTEIPQQRMSKEEREEAGYMCKRILDYARIDYLRQFGYECALKYYVSKEVTLENVCLLARRVK